MDNECPSRRALPGTVIYLCNNCIVYQEGFCHNELSSLKGITAGRLQNSVFAILLPCAYVKNAIVLSVLAKRSYCNDAVLATSSQAFSVTLFAYQMQPRMLLLQDSLIKHMICYHLMSRLCYNESMAPCEAA